MLICSNNWKAPEDYKIYCFNGEPKYILVCVGREKAGHPQFYFFDLDWKLMNFNPDAQKNPNVSIPRPRQLDKMLECARILSKPFPFVRADFYNVGNKIYFGELTFTPAGGMDSDNFHEADLLMGSLLDLT